ncbi:hypothetical protein Q9R46_26130 [Paenibacillus sp. RRE4]|uniref:hypothetical protein n=1 Tax=Paenibacillus sp. RRE4 TaxID=2962587 RepID=UPI002882448D|nr:hypothetical protein [Paenibacillus sp. RRE4]MDT0126149.1 hypothetical protein [Paenibacillus sp. RRE4]
MALTFSDHRNPSTRPEVIDLVSIIEIEPISFVLISRVFNSKRKSQDITQPNYMQTVDRLIDKTFDAPGYNLKSELRNSLKIAMKAIYKMSNEDFNKVKCELLEVVIYRYGPYTKSLLRDKVFMEPTIKNDKELIGNQSKIDSVFYTNDRKPIEFVECKTNITNVIPSTLPITSLTKRDRKKIDYLKLAYDYLSDNLCSPEIYMACYNVDYDDQLENVHNNWGFKFFNFLNPEHIYNTISSGVQ